MNIYEAMKLRDRKDMPQITDFGDFIQDLTIDGYKIISKSVEPSTLEPTQFNFNQDKIDDIVKNRGFDTSIVITNDNYILDGHHRWKACLQAKVLQPVTQIDMTFDELYDYVENKSYVEYKRIGESNYNSNTSMSDFATSLKSFDQFMKELKEEGEGGGDVASQSGGETSVNSVAGIAGKDIPLFKNKQEH